MIFHDPVSQHHAAYADQLIHVARRDSTLGGNAASNIRLHDVVAIRPLSLRTECFGERF